jgi:hypothetical protein
MAEVPISIPRSEVENLARQLAETKALHPSAAQGIMDGLMMTAEFLDMLGLIEIVG